MLKVYNYGGITQANYNTLAHTHTIKNINSKITVNCHVDKTSTVYLIYSFDYGNTFFSNGSLNSVLKIGNDYTTSVNLYMHPGITHIRIYPSIEDAIVSMQVVEYYEPGTQ